MAAVAQADYDNIVPFGTYPGKDCFSSDICKADNSLHTVYVGKLGPQFRAAVDQTLRLSYNTTDLTIQYMSSPTSNTDVIYQYGHLGAQLARADCTDVIDTRTCNQWVVTFDSTAICTYGCSADNLRAIACHETGHTVGLLHGENALPPVSNKLASLGCMQTPFDIDSQPYYLGSHNTREINYTY